MQYRIEQLSKFAKAFESQDPPYRRRDIQTWKGRWIRIEGIGVNSGSLKYAYTRAYVRLYAYVHAYRYMYIYIYAYLYVCACLCAKYGALSYLYLVKEPRSKAILVAMSTSNAQFLVSNTIPAKMHQDQTEMADFKVRQDSYKVNLEDLSCQKVRSVKKK